MSTIYENIFKKMHYLAIRADVSSNELRLLPMFGDLLKETDLSYENEDVVFDLVKRIQIIVKKIERSAWHLEACEYLHALQKELKISYFTKKIERFFSEGHNVCILTNTQEEVLELCRERSEISNGILSGLNSHLESVSVPISDIHLLFKGK